MLKVNNIVIRYIQLSKTKIKVFLHLDIKQFGMGSEAWNKVCLKYSHTVFSQWPEKTE